MSFGGVGQDKRVSLLWIIVHLETYESLSVNWFGKLSVALEPILVDS
jgi:hypothetical protein